MKKILGSIVVLAALLAIGKIIYDKFCMKKDEETKPEEEPAATAEK